MERTFKKSSPARPSRSARPAHGSQPNLFAALVELAVGFVESAMQRATLVVVQALGTIVSPALRRPVRAHLAARLRTLAPVAPAALPFRRLGVMLPTGTPRGVGCGRRETGSEYDGDGETHYF